MPWSSTTIEVSGLPHLPSLVSHLSVPWQSLSLVQPPFFSWVALQSPSRSLSFVMQQPDFSKGFFITPSPVQVGVQSPKPSLNALHCVTPPPYRQASFGPHGAPVVPQFVSLKPFNWQNSAALSAYVASLNQLLAWAVTAKNKVVAILFMWLLFFFLLKLRSHPAL